MPVCQNCKNDLSRASFSKTQLRKEPKLRKCKDCVLSASSITTSEVPTACVPVPVPEATAVEPVVYDKVAAPAPAPAPESSNMYSEKFHCIVCDQDLDKEKFSKNQLKKHEGALRCKSCVKNVENQDGAEAEVPIVPAKETATSKPVEVEVAPKEVQEVVAAPSQVVDVPVVDVPSDEDMDEKEVNKEEPVTEDVVVEDAVEDKEKEVDDAPSDEDTKPVLAVKTKAIDIPAKTEETQTKTNESEQVKLAEEPKLSPSPPPVPVAVVSPEKATPEPTKTASPSPTPAAPSAPKTATPSPKKIPSPARVPVKTASPKPAPMAKPKPSPSPSPPVTQSSPKPAPVQTTIPPSKKQSKVELNEPVSPNIADIETKAMDKATCCIIS